MWHAKALPVSAVPDQDTRSLCTQVDSLFPLSTDTEQDEGKRSLIGSFVTK